MAAYCKKQLEELGFVVEFDDSAAVTGSNTGNLIARLPGTVPGHISFSAHLDTVKPCAGIEPVITSRLVGGELVETVESRGDTILSADDKAGIVAIIEGIRAVVESHEARPSLTVVFTVGEEQSLLGSSALDVSAFTWPESLPATGVDAAEPVPCFVLDADGAPGSIIMEAPYHYTLEARVTGRAAHAGVMPEAGVSVFQIIAEALNSMPLGRIDEETTANIGKVSGGVAINIVPEHATLEGECRSRNEEKVLAQKAAMENALLGTAERFGGEVECTWTLDYPAVIHTENDEIVQNIEAAARACGLEPKHLTSGGGADANIFGIKGADAITLSVGMTNFHTTDEFITVKDLEDLTRLVSALIAEYAK
jgi:tripeptide aminopeptidase